MDALAGFSSQQPIAGGQSLRSSGISSRKALLFLLRYRARAVLNQIKAVRHESLLKVVVVGVLSVVLLAGLFVIFYRGFRFVDDVAGSFRYYLVQIMMSLFFMALTSMLIFSNAVISFSNLFKSPETTFLFSLPIRHDTIFVYKLLESLLFSSWTVFALGLPLLLAYGLQSGSPWYFYPLMLAFLVPFVMLPAAIGSLLGLVLTAVVPRQRGKVLASMALVFLGLTTYVGFSLLKAEHGNNGAYDATEVSRHIQTVLGHLSFAQHRMTPNYWMTEGLLAAGEGRANWMRTSGLFLAALSSSALFFLTLGWFLAGALYESAYSIASGTSNHRRISGRTRLERLCAPLLNRYPQVMILLVKDLKGFMRDPAQWSQVLIFFGILTLYIGNLRNFHPLDDRSNPFYKNLISFLNLGATCMTLATMTSRFVFPSISLEGRSFWVLGLVPLKRRNIMMSKFYFSLAGALLLTTSLILLSNYMLRTAAYVVIIQALTTVFISIGLSGLSVGMGAIFPSFGERSPSKIVSGFGGTLTLIIALMLVGITILGEALLCHRAMLFQSSESPTEQGFGYQFFMVMTGVGVLNCLAAYIPMKLGIRALERVEF